jgi:cobalt/nickel transport system permease protein
MHIADIDYISTHGQSVFHRARPVSKVIFTILLLASMIITDRLEMLLGFITLLLVFTIIAKIPIKQMIHLLIYPLFFSGLFSLILARGSLEMGALLILRAVGAAYILIFLIMTTTYVDLFGFFSLFMPSVLIDIFIFTYRSLFILLDSTTQTFRSIRLRGGYHPTKILMNMKNMASMVGIIIIHALEMSERMYHIYALRGYNGAMPISEIRYWPLHWQDFLIIVIGVVSLMGTVSIWSLL